ncbi:hypothetical protein NEMBOFW57_009880 [Staphylotrichum longicolle]|uniref:DUF2293 domain-containing protein n=1 Tax=Staphylotrichum longicolle TaxID=669026 RepID=A0AAD4HTM8_9PEZI|nr:hypothetical protein NEMBOFW57_009880 [Staphylotrichum longicolle]
MPSTRYDQLLKETTYVNARKTVESLCLDILVKWRGDEETGRDQLDEILCEVIVISDSESDESDEDSDEDDSSGTSSAGESPVDRMAREDGVSRAAVSAVDLVSAQVAANNSRREPLRRGTHAPQKITKASRKDRKEAKWPQRGFNRYQAARDQAWHQAVERQRHGNDGQLQSSGPAAMDRSASQGPQNGIASLLRDGLTLVKLTLVGLDDFVDIVRVSNKFPRQHEARPAPAGDGYPRHERVVGIEYVHPRPSLETRTYSDRGPFHDAKDPLYRSRSNSAVPGAYPGLPYQSYPGRPTPKRDEVMLVD